MCDPGMFGGGYGQRFQQFEQNHPQFQNAMNTIGGAMPHQQMAQPGGPGGFQRPQGVAQPPIQPAPSGAMAQSYAPRPSGAMDA